MENLENKTEAVGIRIVQAIEKIVGVTDSSHQHNKFSNLKASDVQEENQDQHSSHHNSIDFNLNYNIANQTLWASEFTHIVITVDDMVKDFVDYKWRVKVAFADNANKMYFDDYVECHRYNYLLETLTGEGNIAGSTTLDEMEKHIKHPDGTKMSVKVTNLNVALGTIFPNYFEFINPKSKVDVDRFTPQFIKELHTKVMNGLVEEPGIYRKK